MNDIVTINNTNLPVLQYQENPVVTFQMIDQVHERTDGTASRNFKNNRKRFTEGKHFYLVDFTQKDEFRSFGINVPPRGLTVFTKRGYLLLTKSFTDDLAWEVQEKLVDGYFQARSLTPAEQLLKSVQLTVELEKQHKILALQHKEIKSRQIETETRLDRIEAREQDDPGYFAITGYANLVNTPIDENTAKKLGMAAAKLSRQLGVTIAKIRHGRWGLVNSYHESVLKQIFQTYIPTTQARIEA